MSAHLHKAESQVVSAQPNAFLNALTFSNHMGHAKNTLGLAPFLHGYQVHPYIIVKRCLSFLKPFKTFPCKAHTTRPTHPTPPHHAPHHAPYPIAPLAPNLGEVQLMHLWAGPVSYSQSRRMWGWPGVGGKVQLMKRFSRKVRYSLVASECPWYL